MTAKIDKAVWLCLERAVKRFNKSSDRQTLLCPRCVNPKSASEKAAASEWAIAYRLAFYLEFELRSIRLVSDDGPLVVDCEYNRHGGKIKTHRVERRLKNIVEKARNKKWGKPDEDGFYVFSIAPDIVVHQRGTNAKNLLVVEIKKRSNPESEAYDDLKLKLFTESKYDEGYGYKFGAWVVAEDVDEMANRRLNIIKQYKDGKGGLLVVGVSHRT